MEHRWSSRKPCDIQVLLYCPRRGLMAARARDLSEGGMLLDIAAPLPRHAPVHVSFVLESGARRRDLHLDAMVVRHGAGTTALQFLGIPDAALAALRRALRHALPGAPADAGARPADAA